jgi:hypothetical protein
MQGNCVLFNAPVRENYVCARWVPIDAEDNLEFEDFKKEARDKIRERLKQLFNSSTTRNGF